MWKKKWCMAMLLAVGVSMLACGKEAKEEFDEMNGVWDGMIQEVGVAKNNKDEATTASIKSIVQVAFSEWQMSGNASLNNTVSFYYKANVTNEDILSGATAGELSGLFQYINGSCGGTYPKSEKGAYFIVTIETNGVITVSESDVNEE